jgi:HEPN domain-containing protein
MVDIQKQIAYWRSGAVEDWEVGASLVNAGRPRHGLYFAHLAIEKALKAHVCRSTQDMAPRLHSLLRLVERTDLEATGQQREFLARFDRYQVEGRYHDPILAPVTMEAAKKELGEAKEIFEWLIRQL